MDSALVEALALQPDSPPDHHVIDITTIGARSNLPRRIEIWFHRIDGSFYLTGMPVRRNWYANLCKNPRFTVHVKRGARADLPATAAPVDELTRRRVITAVLAQQDLPDYAARGVPRQDLDEWLDRSPLAEIVFDDRELQAAATNYATETTERQRDKQRGERSEVPTIGRHGDSGQPIQSGHDDVRRSRQHRP